MLWLHLGLQHKRRAEGDERIERDLRGRMLAVESALLLRQQRFQSGAALGGLQYVVCAAAALGGGGADEPARHDVDLDLEVLGAAQLLVDHCRLYWTQLDDRVARAALAAPGPDHQARPAEGHGGR